MSIIKHTYRCDYAQLPNRVLQNERLTWEARGLLAYLLSLPADWEVKVAHLVKRSPNCGKDKLYRLFKELEANGYLVRQRTRLAHGVFQWEHIVSAEPLPGLPEVAEPDTAEPEIYKAQTDKAARALGVKAKKSKSRARRTTHTTKAGAGGTRARERKEEPQSQAQSYREGPKAKPPIDWEDEPTALAAELLAKVINWRLDLAREIPIFRGTVKAIVQRYGGYTKQIEDAFQPSLGMVRFGRTYTIDEFRQSVGLTPSY